MNRKPAPEPGIYRDVPFVEYTAWDAMNSSTIKCGQKSMAHMKLAWDITESKDTDSLRLGRYVHSLVLEPDNVAQEYYVATEYVSDDGEIKEYNARSSIHRAYAKKAAGSGTVISKNDHEAAKKIVAALRRHPTAAPLLDPAVGDTELSIVWIEPSTGLKCKARIDKKIGNRVIDLKTTRDASPFAFCRDAYKLGYFLSAAFYADACAIATDQKQRPSFTIVAVEKDGINGVKVFDIPDSELNVARGTYQQVLAHWVECVASNEFPSYDPEPDDLYLPIWAKQDEEDQQPVYEGASVAEIEAEYDDGIPW